MLKDIVWIWTSDVTAGQTAKMDQMNRKVIVKPKSKVQKSKSQSKDLG